MQVELGVLSSKGLSFCRHREGRQQNRPGAGRNRLKVLLSCYGGLEEARRWPPPDLPGAGTADFPGRIDSERGAAYHNGSRCVRKPPAMVVQRRFPLKGHNSFGLDVRASAFVQVRSLEDLVAAVDLAMGSYPKFAVLGGGSNVLFTGDFDGLVIQMGLRGVRIVRQDESSVWIGAAAGENWSELVRFCVERNWWGVENLSLIPGTVGGAPVQNVGAYGVELKDVLHCVQGLDLQNGSIRTLSRDECEFGYRTSVFKEKLCRKFVVTSLVLQLSKEPKARIQYEGLARELGPLKFERISARDVAEAVCRLRRSKLPDPKEIGNAGSFFRNPEIPEADFEDLRSRHPGMPGFPAGSGRIRVPAGWLIEQCGWKGRRMGNAGVYEKHALVIVNLGGATGREILSLAHEVRASVLDRFGIRLEPEVRIL